LFPFRLVPRKKSLILANPLQYRTHYHNAQGRELPLVDREKLDKNMTSSLHFETPENIQVTYHPAGLGTRFIAWFVDGILLTIVCFVMFIVLACSGFAFEEVLRDVFEPMVDQSDFEAMDQKKSQQILMYVMGISALIWGLSSFFYFGLSELLLRGQTIGKRSVGIRVVQSNGFSLDPWSVLIRNVFRVVDQLPILWLVPVLSSSGQRFGDMVAGTLVIVENPEDLSLIRTAISERPAELVKFRFDSTKLKQLRPQDFEGIEKILDRWQTLKNSEQEKLLHQILPPLAKRLGVDLPDDLDRIHFLQDLLAAEYKRQNRSLG